MPITIRGAVKGFRSDHLRESVLSFTIPQSDKVGANQISDLTEQELSITVCTIKELRDHAKATKAKK